MGCFHINRVYVLFLSLKARLADFWKMAVSCKRRNKKGVKLTQKKKLKTKMAYLTHTSQLLKAVILALSQRSLSAVCPGSVRIGSDRSALSAVTQTGGALKRCCSSRVRSVRKRPQMMKTTKLTPFTQVYTHVNLNLYKIFPKCVLKFGITKK